MRIAELAIEPAAVARYRAALDAEIEASLRLEPGVLMLAAVTLRADPAQVRILEVYADRAAYEAHLQSPHFLAYKRQTAGMILSLTLHETDPVRLGVKPDGIAAQTG